MVRTGVDRVYVRGSNFDGVLGHVNAAQNSVPHFLNLRQRVHNFLTGLCGLGTKIDDAYQSVSNL